jgi:Concanavalin A-like lectin/glucanases superfamily
MKPDVAILAALAFALPSVAWAGEPIARYALDGDVTDSRGGPAGIATGVTPVADRHGDADRAFGFRGAGQIIADNPNLPLHRSPRTLAAWFRTADPSAVQVVVNYGTPTRGHRFGILLHAGHVKLVGESADLVSAHGFADGKWHHAAATYDPTAPGATTNLYVDGMLEAAGSPALDTLYQPMVIGNAVFGHGAEWFTGSIDDVRVYDHALGPSEVAALGGASTPSGRLEGDERTSVPWTLLAVGGGLISVLLGRRFSTRFRARPPAPAPPTRSPASEAGPNAARAGSTADVHHRALHTVLFDHPDGLTVADIADELRLSIDEAEDLIAREQRKLLIDVIGYEGGEIRYITLRRVRPSPPGDIQ